MNQRNRLRNISALTVMVCGLGLLTLPNAGYAQGTIIEEESTTTERAREAEREAARARAAERERDVERAKRDSYVQEKHYYEQPGELYVAGFGGYTFGHDLADPEGTGTLAGASFGNAGIGLKDSGVYGLKVGYFLPKRLNWLGMEVEGFHTNPQIEQHSEGGESISEGSHLRVTTLAFNLIARAKMACETRTDRRKSETLRRPAGEVVEPTGEMRPTGEVVQVTHRDYEFCRLQPYVGVGLGVFFARAKDEDGTSSDNGVPGLNALAGVRYFLTENFALFGEYKYNRASFDFDNIDSGPAGQGGFNATYSASHVVGGLSLHF